MVVLKPSVTMLVYVLDILHAYGCQGFDEIVKHGETIKVLSGRMKDDELKSFCNYSSPLAVRSILKVSFCSVCIMLVGVQSSCACL